MTAQSTKHNQILQRIRIWKEKSVVTNDSFLSLYPPSSTVKYTLISSLSHGPDLLFLFSDFLAFLCILIQYDHVELLHVF